MKKVIIMFSLLLVISPVFSYQKVALLIANNDYTIAQSLKQPIAEAKILKSALINIGFHVELIENADRNTFIKSLYKLKTIIDEGGTLFFHYGGHAIQYKGDNYLLPTDANIQDETQVSLNSIRLNDIMETVASLKTGNNIIILDACRNNPYSQSTYRNLTRGLSIVSRSPQNTIVVYSAEANSVAIDGLFTPCLTEYIVDRYLSITEIIMKTRNKVYAISEGKQLPSEYSQLLTPIYLYSDDNKITEEYHKDQKILNSNKGNESKTSQSNESTTMLENILFYEKEARKKTSTDIFATIDLVSSLTSPIKEGESQYAWMDRNMYYLTIATGYIGALRERSEEKDPFGCLYYATYQLKILIKLASINSSSDSVKEKMIEEIIANYKVAADFGIAKGMEGIGNIYLFGIIKPKSKILAEKWLISAAKKYREEFDEENSIIILEKLLNVLPDSKDAKEMLLSIINK